MAAEITQDEPKTKDEVTTNTITKESILQGAIEDIDKLEKGVKSVKTLIDLLVIHQDMPLTLTPIGLQLEIFKMMLQHQGILPKPYTLSDLDNNL